MPLGTNVARNDLVIQNATPSEQAHYQSDISFIGSTYQEKCPYNSIKLSDEDRGYADGLIESQLQVYGANIIEELLSDSFVSSFMQHNPQMYHFPAGSTPAYKELIAQYYLSVKVAEQERLRMLRLLSSQFEVDMYTNSDTSKMPRIHNRGFARSLTEMPLIFHYSKINLNITAKSIRSGLPLRIFDVLGCGGFLITNYQSELPDWFTIGEDLVAYSSPKELIELCAYYLAHEEERKQIAMNGYLKVKQYHTFDHRIAIMLEKAFGGTHEDSHI
jgi:spore maturation protein CgeB